MMLGLGLGAGVTAHSVSDAMMLLDSAYGDELPQIVDINENITYVELETEHVKKNMGTMAVRGIWFPNLPGLT